MGRHILKAEDVKEIEQGLEVVECPVIASSFGGGSSKRLHKVFRRRLGGMYSLQFVLTVGKEISVYTDLDKAVVAYNNYH